MLGFKKKTTVIKNTNNPTMQGAPNLNNFKLGSRFYYAYLPEEDKPVYRAIYDGWVKGSSVTELILPGVGLTTPSGAPLGDLLRAVNEDNPHLFHIEYTQYWMQRTGDKVKVWTDNVYTPTEFQAVYDRLKKKVDWLLLQAKAYPKTIDQLRFLHDYLCENVVYDYGKPDPRSQREVHTVVGSLLNGACVCDGFSRAYRLLCDLLHISCIVVIGEGPTDDANCGPHAWNIVKFDGNRYHVDVTWDCNMTAGRIVKDFEFLRSDAAAARRHTWQRDKYPTCKQDYPRATPQPLLDTPDKLEQEVCRYLRAHKKNFLLRLGGPLVRKDRFADEYSRILNKHSDLYPKHGTLPYYFYEKYAYAEVVYTKK